MRIKSLAVLAAALLVGSSSFGKEVRKVELREFHEKALESAFMRDEKARNGLIEALEKSNLRDLGLKETVIQELKAAATKGGDFRELREVLRRNEVIAKTVRMDVKPGTVEFKGALFDAMKRDPGSFGEASGALKAVEDIAIAARPVLDSSFYSKNGVSGLLPAVHEVLARVTSGQETGATAALKGEFLPVLRDIVADASKPGSNPEAISDILQYFTNGNNATVRGAAMEMKNFHEQVLSGDVKPEALAGFQTMARTFNRSYEAQLKKMAEGVEGIKLSGNETAAEIRAALVEKLGEQAVSDQLDRKSGRLSNSIATLKLELSGNRKKINDLLAEGKIEEFQKALEEEIASVSKDLSPEEAAALAALRFMVAMRELHEKTKGERGLSEEDVLTLFFGPKDENGQRKLAGAGGCIGRNIARYFPQMSSMLAKVGLGLTGLAGTGGTLALHNSIYGGDPEDRSDSGGFENEPSHTNRDAAF